MVLGGREQPCELSSILSRSPEKPTSPDTNMAGEGGSEAMAMQQEACQDSEADEPPHETAAR